jgi:hypothetical protein
MQAQSRFGAENILCFLPRKTRGFEKSGFDKRRLEQHRTVGAHRMRTRTSHEGYENGEIAAFGRSFRGVGDFRSRHHGCLQNVADYMVAIEITKVGLTVRFQRGCIWHMRPLCCGNEIILYNRSG